MTAARDLTCQELVELVTDYFEGKLGGPEAAGLEAHLDACQHCRSYLAQMRMVIRMLGKLRKEHISEEARLELVQAFRDWRDGLAS